MLGLVNPEDTSLQAEGDLQSFQKVQDVVVQLPIQKHIHKKKKKNTSTLLPLPHRTIYFQVREGYSTSQCFITKIVKIFRHTDEGILW